MLLYLSLEVLSSVAKSFVSSTHGKGNDFFCLLIDVLVSGLEFCYSCDNIIFVKITNNRSVIIIKIVMQYEISCITDSGNCNQYSRNVRIFALTKSETIRDIINLFLLTSDSSPSQ